ncbi:hypothetical protein D918_07302 [Trichuris suis]|nr:hypothetical protein D918_07302 [Trichuris suis]
MEELQLSIVISVKSSEKEWRLPEASSYNAHAFGAVPANCQSFEAREKRFKKQKPAAMCALWLRNERILTGNDKTRTDARPLSSGEGIELKSLLNFLSYWTTTKRVYNWQMDNKSMIHLGTMYVYFDSSRKMFASEEQHDYVHIINKSDMPWFDES